MHTYDLQFVHKIVVNIKYWIIGYHVKCANENSKQRMRLFNLNHVLFNVWLQQFQTMPRRNLLNIYQYGSAVKKVTLIRNNPLIQVNWFIQRFSPIIILLIKPTNVLDDRVGSSTSFSLAAILFIRRSNKWSLLLLAGGRRRQTSCSAFTILSVALSPSPWVNHKTFNL